MNNKIFLFMLLGMFILSSSVSALDFDNVGTYDEGSREITITNSFGLGGDIAKIKLNSELVEYVIPGKNRKVAEFTITNFDDGYSNTFKEMNFFNKNAQDSRFNRAFIYKNKVLVGTRNVNTYKYPCELRDTGDGLRNECWREFARIVSEPVYEWQDFDYGSDLASGEITVGIFTNVYAGDNVEWIPTFFGVEIDEWAVWTAGLNNEILSYYKMDETSGEMLDSTGLRNGTLPSTGVDQNEAGIINTGYKFTNDTNGAANLSQYTFIEEIENYTINLWVNFTDSGFDRDTVLTGNDGLGSGPASLSKGNGFSDRNLDYVVGTLDAEISLTYSDGYPLDEFMMVTLRYNGTGIAMFLNGSIVAQADQTGYTKTQTTDLWIGADPQNANRGMIGNIDEIGIWNRSLSLAEITDLYNAGLGISFQPLAPRIAITLNLPTNGSSSNQSSRTFNASFAPVDVNLSNATIFIYDSSDVLFNSTTNIVTGASQNDTLFNIGGFLVGTYSWNVLGCGINITGDKTCSFAENNFTFTRIAFTENSQTFNGSAYETAQESFTVNISYNSSEFTSSSANLVYDGTSYAGTKSGAGDDITFSRTITLPTVTSPQNKSFYWEISLTDSLNTILTNSTTQNQTVNNANLSLCGDIGGNVNYLNFTFLNEADDTKLNASNDLTDFTFWLGDGSVTQSYITSNATEHDSYSFCFDPSHLSFTTDLTFKYSGSGYPIRTFQYSDVELTNFTTSQVLYLLGSSDGIYSSIQTNEVAGTPISGVTLTIEREFDGVWTVIGVAITGSDGIATFWVNPNFDHRITGIKSGYVNTQATITPSQSLYTLVMTKTTGDAEFSGSTEGMSWKTTPVSGYLPPGTYNFAFNLTANLDNLDGGYCKFELVNKSQDIVASNTGGNSSACNLGISYIHITGELLYGKLYVDTTNTTGYILIDSDQRWVDIEGTDVATWKTIFSFFSELKELDEWGDGAHRQEWNRTVAFFLFLTITLGIFSFFTQWDSQNPGAAVLMMFVVILIASFSGWFYVGNAPLIEAGYDKLDKYVIAMLTFSLTIAWFTGYLRRTT